MIADNDWHDGIIYQLLNGRFVLAEHLDHAQKDERPKITENGGVKYQDVRYNWNRGQPIVDFGNFQMVIGDINVES